MAGMSEPRSVGLVHDYLLVKRGAERTFCEIAACWPGAPVYTLLYDNSMMPDDGAREKDKAARTATFQRAIQNMKILAEGGTLPARQ